VTECTLELGALLLILDTDYDLYSVTEDGLPDDLIAHTPIVDGNRLIYSNVPVPAGKCLRIGIFPGSERAEWVNILTNSTTEAEEVYTVTTECTSIVRVIISGFTTGQSMTVIITDTNGTLYEGALINGTTEIPLPAGLNAQDITISTSWEAGTPTYSIDIREACPDLISNCITVMDADCTMLPVEATNGRCAFGFVYPNGFTFKMLVPGAVQNFTPTTELVNISDQRGILRTAFADVRRKYLLAFDPISREALEGLSIMRLLDTFTVNGVEYSSTEEELNVTYDDQDGFTGSFEMVRTEPRRAKPC
jgi:hypothetical protein